MPLSRWSPCCLGCCVRSCAVWILSPTDSPFLSFGKSHQRERYAHSNPSNNKRLGLQVKVVMAFSVSWFISLVLPSRSWVSGLAVQSFAPVWSWVTTMLRAWSMPPKKCSLLTSCHPWTPSTPSMRSIRLCSTCTPLPRTSGVNASQEEPSDWTRLVLVVFDCSVLVVLCLFYIMHN